MEATAKNAVIDYVVMARTALTKAERLSDDIEGAPAKVQMCREAWRDYGACLLAQRKLMPNKNEFGAWVKANGLDTGRARHAQVRSDAMWMAEHWDDLILIKSLRNHDPQNIRTECRAAGYEWAGGKTERKTREPISESPKNIGWTLAVEHSYNKLYGKKLPKGFSRNTLAQTAEIKMKLQQSVGFRIGGKLTDGGTEADEIARAIAILATPKQKQTEEEPLSQTAQAKLDRAIEREIARLRGQFKMAVEEAVRAKVEAATERSHQFYLKYTEEAKEIKAKYERYIAKIDGIMSLTEYKFVLGCLHSDRPDRSVESLDKAFNIFKRLGDSVKW